MSVYLSIAGGLLLVLVLLPRLFFLAPWCAGWAMYLANVGWEVFPKKVGLGRFWLEACAAVLSLGLLKLGGLPKDGVIAFAAILAVVEIANRILEWKLVKGPGSSGLIFTLEAPFIERLPQYRLGVLWVGIPCHVELIVGNPGSAPVSAKIHLEAPKTWLGGQSPDQAPGPVPAGGTGKVKWILRPDASQGPGVLEITVETMGDCRRIRIEHGGCRPAKETRILRAEISRYPGGRRSAFLWRGDMDLYDKLTFQSIAGLEVTLGLAARYAMPQTMCLSTRLSLDEAAARAWAEHDGRDHGAAEIPLFIEWLRKKTDLRHACPWPAQSTKPYVLELGNHGHLHYDTAAAAAPENNWQSHARMGAGRYPWVGPDTSSFGEQRDNILEAARWCERLLGFVPRSWAKPGRCNDADTARAAEAAGCDILSGSDIRVRDNVLLQPPPHHPGGTDAVELTSRYPPDPQHVHHFAMLLFWLHRARRLGLPMVFMCHQHMRQWEGPACGRFTEALLRTVLADFHGEFYIDTLFGIGKYWREALSPKTRRISVALTGARLVVENRSDMDFERVPVDLELENGGRATVLVPAPAGKTVAIDLNGGQEH